VCGIIYSFVFEDLNGSELFAGIIDSFARDSTSTTFLSIKAALPYFSVVVPLLIINSIFLYRFRWCLKNKTKSHGLYQSFLFLFMVLLITIPISYGRHLYDWKIIPVKDSYKIFDDTKESFSGGVWLLGRFNKQYFFLKKDDIKTKGIIKVFDESQIKSMNFALTEAASLRAEMELKKGENNDTLSLYEDFLDE
ncbi:hypothetical protein KA005_07875, partial [bacterium]|nr:hypothetical protein [bacterium]